MLKIDEERLLFSTEKIEGFLVRKLFRIYQESFQGYDMWGINYFSGFFSTLEGDSLSVVVFLEEKPIGAAVGRTAKNGNYFILSSIFLKKDLRGRGIAERLLKEFCYQVKNKKSFDKVKLHFRESKKDKLKKFYERGGFSDFQEDGFYSSGEKRFCMYKDLE